VPEAGRVMNRPKVITKLIRTCEDCSHGSYDSGGQWLCIAMNRSFPGNDAKTQVQPWCPLDDAPASLI